MVEGAVEYPFAEFLHPKHASTCEQACYECLQRFGNQAYHGLLDWRLALDYLALLHDAKFQAHLPNTTQVQWTESWRGLRERMIALILRMTADPERLDIAGFPLLRLDKTADSWAAVVHPLWNWDHIVSVEPALADFVETHRTVALSTFELARRPAGTLDFARRRLRG
jgi:hypothetical protein